MSKPADIIAIALAEIGYHEKATNASLDDKGANSGTANWTKYARDLAAVGYYNGNKNGYAWCDVFVDWCFFKAYGPVEGQRIQCQSGPLGAGCIYSAQYYREKGRFDNLPKVGDQVFFQYGGEIGHTGIVVAVNGTVISTVEGNSSDQVVRNTYSCSDPCIAGYGHPLYSDDDEPEPDEPEIVSCEVILPLLRIGDTGNAVISAQALLITKGYPCGGSFSRGREIPDGEFGPVTESSVLNFQNSENIQPDGVIRTETWTALIT